MDLGSKGCIGAGLGDEKQHGQDIMELNGWQMAERKLLGYLAAEALGWKTKKVLFQFGPFKKLSI